MVLDRHDRLLEMPFVPAPCGALLAFDGVGVDVVAPKSILGGDEVGRNALRQKVRRDCDRGVDRPGAAGRTMPTRLIDSAPPPIVISLWPDMTWAAAKLVASRPEAQKRLT